MNKSSLQARLLSLTLVPILFMALVLGTLLVIDRFADINHIAQQKSEILTEKYRLRLRAPELQYNELEQLSHAALEEDTIRSFTLLDEAGRELVHSGPHFHPPKTPLHLTSTFDLQRQETVDGSLVTAYLGILNAGEDHPHPAWLVLEFPQSSLQLEKYETLFVTLLIVGLGIGFSAILVQSSSRKLVRPIQSMLDTAAKLRGGHFDIRFNSEGLSEFAELQQGLNRMLENLQAEVADLKLSMSQANEDLRETLEAMEVQNIELSLARKEAVEGNRVKSEFLANISHEIRTPLNGIMGFAKLLGRSPLNARQLEYVQTIQKSSDSLLAIINDVLDLSKIEAGKLVLDQAPLDIEEVVYEVLNMLAPLADEKQLEQVAFIYDDTPRHILGDSLRLRQILTNLVNNAIKFTDAGEITVRVAMEERSSRESVLRFSVTDTGIGLDDSSRADLFRAFSQGDASTSRKYGGTGLGLVISKHLVEQMGGEISFESSPGKGSTFWFTIRASLNPYHNDEPLPSLLRNKMIGLIIPHAATEQQIKHLLHGWGCKARSYSSINYFLTGSHGESHDIILTAPGNSVNAAEDLQQIAHHHGGPILVLHRSADHIAETLHNPDQQFHFLTKPASPRKLQAKLLGLLDDQTRQLELMPTLNRQALRILSVDDNSANLKLVCTLLQDLGIETTGASSGQEAIALVQNQDFDLIFMDVQMPGMNGLEATREIRSLRREKHIPVIALTAHALANEKEQLLRGGMDDYVTKPLQENVLSHIIAKWTGIDKNALKSISDISQPATEITQAVVDEEESLRLASGKRQLANDMLKMLTDSLSTEKARILDAFQSKNMEEFLNRVHYLHGATRYCGVPQLRARSQDLESAIKKMPLSELNPWVKLQPLLTRLQQAIDDVMQWKERQRTTEGQTLD